ncbi:MAG TPA: hypothetical protein VGG29_19085 [Caulobacteraceae bacterium]|jgi:hypothetical protein
MPRLNPNFHRAVFFLYGIDPTDGDLGVCGTGFLVGVQRSSPTPGGNFVWQPRHVYAVTSKHVLQDGSFIRINVKGGGSRLLELEPDTWTSAGSGEDLAAIDITDKLQESDDFRLIHESWLVTRDFSRSVQLGIGEDGFMLGLFRDVPGADRNVVAGRFGNLSLLAQDDLPIKRPDRSKRPTHIFDIRSRPGFSGSPVFIYRTPGGDLRETHNGPPMTGIASRVFARADASRFYRQAEVFEARDNTFVKLLGVHVGQYKDVVRASKSAGTEVAGQPVLDGDRLFIPNSMTLVVPAWEVLDLLQQTHFGGQRTRREADDDESERLPYFEDGRAL